MATQITFTVRHFNDNDNFENTSLELVSVDVNGDEVHAIDIDETSELIDGLDGEWEEETHTFQFEIETEFDLDDLSVYGCTAADPSVEYGDNDEVEFTAV